MSKFSFESLKEELNTINNTQFKVTDKVKFFRVFNTSFTVQDIFKLLLVFKDGNNHVPPILEIQNITDEHYFNINIPFENQNGFFKGANFVNGINSPYIDKLGNIGTGDYSKEADERAEEYLRTDEKANKRVKLLACNDNNLYESLIQEAIKYRKSLKNYVFITTNIENPEIISDFLHNVSHKPDAKGVRQVRPKNEIFDMINRLKETIK